MHTLISLGYLNILFASMTQIRIFLTFLPPKSVCGEEEGGGALIAPPQLLRPWQ